MKTVAYNMAKILSGDINAPVTYGNTIVIKDSRIVPAGSGDAGDCDVAIGAGGMMAWPASPGPSATRQIRRGEREWCSPASRGTSPARDRPAIPGMS